MDLRKRVIAYVQNGGQNVTACKLFAIAHDTIYRWLRQQPQHGHVHPKPPPPARPRKIDEHLLLSFITQYPDKTLKEIAQHFCVSPWGIAKACRRLALTQKKVLSTKKVMSKCVSTILSRIHALSKQAIIYIDQTGFDNQLQRLYGRAPRGQLVPGKRSGRKGTRISLMAGLCQKRLVAPLRFQGHCNSELFNKWLQEGLLHKLKPGQTVIMDNASFHKSSLTLQLIEPVSCKLM